MIKDRNEYGKTSEIAQPIQEIVDTRENNWSKLKGLKLGRDLKSLNKNPINQPIIEFIEATDKIIEDINYDNVNELKDLTKKYNEMASKDYYKDLELFQVFQRMKYLYDKQTFKLMNLPDLCAKAILEMREIIKEQDLSVGKVLQEQIDKSEGEVFNGV